MATTLVPNHTSVERQANASPLHGPSILALLLRHAQEQPDETAYTFVDYAQDATGFTERLTWSQLAQRTSAVADELRLCGSIGDRAAIMAPHGLDYITAFLGALHAGFIAVPLSVPQFGIHDERVSSALRDSMPAVILTTSAAADVTNYACKYDNQPAPSIVEVDLLNFDCRRDTSSTVSGLPGPAYLQYTSGSTRAPAGVVISHKNVVVNCDQMFSDFAVDPGKIPSGSFVSWLPFYHDMGLFLGIFGAIYVGRPAVILSPMSFLRRPASWMQLLARNSAPFSAAPNFAFELATRRTSDDDMAGLDLGDVIGILSGSERVHLATLKRFTERFGRYNLSETVIRPSYGLAEATVYVATAKAGATLKTVAFQYEDLSAGWATPCEDDGQGRSELVSYGAPRSPAVRIVDPDSRIEKPARAIGEIWVHGDNVAMCYWRKPNQTRQTFGARLVHPSPGTPDGPWMRTGDLGVMSDGELFVVGRIKDLLIVDGRNHYPDDIEATIREITGGRVAAISIPDERSESLVAIVELARRGSRDAAMQRLDTVRSEITSAVSKSHGLRLADLLMVKPGSIPVTTSGKIRRSACVERYRQHQFTRLDVPE
jgi:acyl-CoA synthetase (AMP-forming)/AMP-acid ligase II